MRVASLRPRRPQQPSALLTVNSVLGSALPAPFDHFEKLYHAAIDIVSRYRNTT